MDWTIVTDNISNSELKKLIKNHDKIIMLGHGNEFGLFGKNRMIIDSKLVYLLREKINVFIWCNADIFVKKYSLKGFYTGMIISDYNEANLCCISATDKEIVISNKLFAKSIRIGLSSSDILEKTLKIYDSSDNSIILFNRNNLYYL